MWRCLVLAMTIFTSVATLQGADFPASSATTEPRTLWKYQPAGKAIDSCVVNRDMVFLSLETGPIVALHAADGKLAWEHDYGVPASKVLAFTDDLVLVMLVGSEQSIAALERKSGDVRWLRLLRSQMSVPVVVGNILCGGGFDGLAYGINLADGKTVWETDYLADAPPDPPGFDGKQARTGDHPARPGHASSDGDAIYFSVFDQCRALRFDAKTGTRKASYPTRGWMYMKPTVTDKYVFVGSQDDHMYCFDKQSGAVVWKHKTKARVEAPACVDDDRVYWGSCDANLYCLNRDTGEVVWTFATDKYPEKYGGPIYEPAVVDGPFVILPTMEGQVYFIDAALGTLRGKHRPSAQSQVDDSAWDGQRLFVQTRKNFDNMGEEAIYAIGK